MRELLHFIFAIVALATVSEKLAAGDTGQKKTMLFVTYHDTDIVRTDGSADPRRRRFVQAGPQMWRSEVFEGKSVVGWSIQNGNELWHAGTLQGTAVLQDTAADTARFVLFGPPETDAIRSLRIGNEIRFFARHSARQLPDEFVGNTLCEVHRLDTIKTQLTLWIKKDHGVPVQLGIVSPYNDYKVFYDTYLPNAPFDTVAFKVPKRPAGPPPGTAVGLDTSRTK